MVLMTGFPGFIAGRLVGALTERYGRDTRWLFLVEARFLDQARTRCAALERTHPELAGNWEVVAGDIRAPGLGLDADTLARVRSEVRVVWHLAALYNLSAPLPLSYSINVDGTVHVLDLCASIPDLECLAYISTCYVAGNRTGRVYEDELDEGQDFKNHYESTKFWAEKHVQHRWGDIPSVILRPAIVVGDSVTGETAKGDGPYYVMQLLRRLPAFVPAVQFGPSTALVNLVPVDFVVQAMATIAPDPRAVGRVFQLADPDPLPAKAIMEHMAAITGHGRVRGTLPRRVVLRLLASRRVQNLLGVPQEAFPYFDQEVAFDCANTLELLDEAGLRCPRLPDFLPQLYRYLEAHPEIVVPVSR